MPGMNGLRKAALLLSVVGTLAAVFTDRFRWVSAALAVVGLSVLAIQEWIRTRERTGSLRHEETVAKILASGERGNVYFELFERDLKETGRSADASSLLRKALDADPDDVRALSWFATGAALAMSHFQFIRHDRDSISPAALEEAVTAAKRALEIEPESTQALGALGMLEDVQGFHERARERFEEVGRLEAGPNWRLAVATSWGIEGKPQEALEEIERAVAEGADGWIVEFYLGRALMDTGLYDEAIPHLEAAYAVRGNRDEIVYHLRMAHYHVGHFFAAARHDLRLALSVGLANPGLSIVRTFRAAFETGMLLLLGLSKLTWRASEKHPRLRGLRRLLPPACEPEFTLASVLAESGHFRQAARHCRSALAYTSEADPEHAMIVEAIALWDCDTPS